MADGSVAALRQQIRDRDVDFANGSVGEEHEELALDHDVELEGEGEIYSAAVEIEPEGLRPLGVIAAVGIGGGLLPLLLAAWVRRICDGDDGVDGGLQKEVEGFDSFAGDRSEIH